MAARPAASGLRPALVAPSRLVAASGAGWVGPWGPMSHEPMVSAWRCGRPGCRSGRRRPIRRSRAPAPLRLAPRTKAGRAGIASRSRCRPGPAESRGRSRLARARDHFGAFGAAPQPVRSASGDSPFGAERRLVSRSAAGWRPAGRRPRSRPAAGQGVTGAPAPRRPDPPRLRPPPAAAPAARRPGLPR